MKTHTLSILVENKPGVLTRVSGLFARRAFNIHSLAVGTTENENISRITIVTDESNAPIEQITLQLQKLINVLKVQVLDDANTVHREIVLIKVSTQQGELCVRPEVIGVANLFRVKVVDVAAESITIEATGKASKLEALTRALLPYGILEIVRSGTIAISRGDDIINLYRRIGEAVNDDN
jgi:acetolactate synthase-1/3 small subunit